MTNEFLVKCISNKDSELYLKEGSLYTVLMVVYIGETEFYRLKEIRNKSFESSKFILNPKPGFSAPVAVAVNDNYKEEILKAA